MKSLNLTIGKSLAGAAVLAWLVFWIWAFVFADPGDPNELESLNYGPVAERACAAAITEIDAMPSPREAETPLQRSEQVRESTLVVEDMVAALHDAADTALGAHDTEILSGWLADYDAYVADRWRYVDTLANADESSSDKDLAFTLTQRVRGGIYTTRVDTFARANDMPSCQIPGDV